MRSQSLARSRYSDDLLAHVAEGWRRLAADERQGVTRAAHLAADLSALGAPPALLAIAARLVKDEVRHVGVCARVIEAVGVAGPPEAAPLEIVVGLPRATPASEGRLARALVGELALAKPVTAASFAAARARVREPLLGWAYTELLRDEARHATFGAKAAAWVVRHWTARQRQALWIECLAASQPDAPPSGEPSAEAEALGLLPGRVESTLPRWILPHLAPIGMPNRPSNDLHLLQ